MSDACQLTLELKGELPDNGPDRRDVLADILIQAVNRLTWAAHVPPCDLHQVLVEMLVEEMVDNGHEGCAGRLVDKIGIKLAVAQKAMVRSNN